jgi:hypothetical protein
MSEDLSVLRVRDQTLALRRLRDRWKSKSFPASSLRDRTSSKSSGVAKRRQLFDGVAYSGSRFWPTPLGAGGEAWAGVPMNSLCWQND